jgi:radical SAM superfamily enzyme YgiQ (UPF0313 family)
MDILFIHIAPTVEERYGNKRFGEVGGLLPPLGLASIAGYLREYGYECAILDTVATNMTEKEILHTVKKLNPEVIGYTALTPSYPKVRDTAELIREHFPEILQILGGHHATVLKEYILENDSCFDVLVYGEGEVTSKELLDFFKEYKFHREKIFLDKTLCSIKGIAFKNKDEIIVTPQRELIPDINILPFPARDMLPMEKYIPLPNQYIRPPVVHMVVQRGCPFDCSFCSNNAVFGRRVRKRAPELVVEEIKYVIKNYGAREISFWDDTITVDKKWLGEVCEGILRNDLDIKWSCYASVNTVDYEILTLMKRAGCWNIFYGYESGVQELLDNINKGITLEKIEYVNGLTKKAGIEIRGSFMIGLPGETPELAIKTLNFAIRLDPEYVQFSLTTPFPGTKLYSEASRYGYLDNDFNKYNGWTPVFVPYGYRDGEELLQVQQFCHRKFYLRPSYVMQRIKSLRGIDDIIRYYKGLKMAIGFCFNL